MAPANQKPEPFNIDSEAGAAQSKAKQQESATPAPNDDWRKRYDEDQAAQRVADTRFPTGSFRRKEDTAGG